MDLWSYRVYILFCIPLGLAAYYDYKYKKLPDPIAIILWLCYLLWGRDQALLAGSFVAFFALSYMLKATSGGKFLAFGWGDVLALPSIVAFMIDIHGLQKLTSILIVMSIIMALGAVAIKRFKLQEKTSTFMLPAVALTYLVFLLLALFGF